MPSSAAYVLVAPETAPPAIAALAPFRAVVIAEQSVTPAWQSLISDWLVQSGCLYMMAWGQNCSSWDDSVDLANLKFFDFGEIPDDQFVMTTWHTDEPLSEVFWFAKHSAFHPTIDLEQTILIHVAATAKEHEFVQAYNEA